MPKLQLKEILRVLHIDSAALSGTAFKKPFQNMAKRMDTADPADATSYIIPISHYDTAGFCRKFPLRRHRWEAEANAGCHAARLDWIKYIGPTEIFGAHNPINGNLYAVALPLAKPERLHLVSYVLDFAFLYDEVIESDGQDEFLSRCNHPDEQERQRDTHMDPALGVAQIQAKIATQLASVDEACTKRIEKTWKEMLDRSSRDKDRKFNSLREYLDFRNVDVGPFFSEAVALFSMGTTLTEDEDAQLDPIRKPWSDALSLQNDYQSFDREYIQYQKPRVSQPFLNAVWLHMQWHNVGIDIAKKAVIDMTLQFEAQFLDGCAKFREQNNLSGKLDVHLDVLTYMLSGNAVWGSNCPRYNPEYRYDQSVGIEDKFSVKGMLSTLGIEYEIRLVDKAVRNRVHFDLTNSSIEAGFTTSANRRSTDHKLYLSSCNSPISGFGTRKITAVPLSKRDILGSAHVEAPISYVKSLPSQGTRDAFINALNIWLNVPTQNIRLIKSLSNRLHSASLLLDDIEDGSILRRGQPAAHTVFGTAQTINSGCWEFVKAVEEAQHLGPESVKIVLEELSELHTGQSYDIHWTKHNLCPSEDEYVEMVKKKTGGLFQLIARLLLENSDKAYNMHLASEVQHLVSLIGVQYQIRDDYRNIFSEDYCEQKGYCQDLDEGKFSFPLMHAFNKRSGESKLLLELFQRARVVGCLSLEQKKLALKELDYAGSMEYTRETLEILQGYINECLKKLEDITKQENWILRALVHRLAA